MKFLSKILTFIIIAPLISLSQVSVNSGSFYNYGNVNLKGTAVFNNEAGGLVVNSSTVIKLKNENTNSLYDTTIVGKILVEDSSGTLNSTGNIINDKGVIYSKGYFRFTQDSLDGEVVYDLDYNFDNYRFIDPANYYSVKFLGKNRKTLAANKPITARKLFYMDSTASLDWDPGRTNIKFIIKDSIHHDGLLNPTQADSYIILDNSVQAQKIMGKGRAFSLQLDNSLGADINDTTSTNKYKDGLNLSKLELTRGQLRNKANANITLDGGAGSATITRTANGSLAVEPVMKSKVDLVYTGLQGETLIQTGAEVPTVQVDKINNIHVENIDGVALTASATVNNKVIVNSALYTYNKDASGQPINEKELVLNSKNDPEFLQDTSEIHGKFSRINFDSSKKILMNNKYTYAEIKTDPALFNAKKLTFNVKPGIQYPANPQRGQDKVARIFEVSATDDINGLSDTKFVLNDTLTISYAWRHEGNVSSVGNFNINETFNDGIAGFNRLILQNWKNDRWIDNKQVTRNTINSRWASIVADEDEMGEFAIGFPASNFMEIFARVVMEGPYQYGSITADLMYSNLRDSNRLPATPPNIYPYNLDANRLLNNITDINSVKYKDIVDWVVIEMRDRDLNPTKRAFRTCLLKKDGSLVDIDGVSTVALTKQFTSGDIDTTGATPYFIAVRHRNHMTVMTDKQITLSNNGNNILVDLADPSAVYGGQNSLKYLGKRAGKSMWGSIAGNYVSETLQRDTLFNGLENIDVITQEDRESVWDYILSKKNTEGYLNQDFNLDGIITTKDFNISWNNRRKFGPIK
jgi:hypothetical protein